MTTAETPLPLADQPEDQLSRDLDDLHVRAQQAAAQLADLQARLASLEEQIQRHQRRR